MIFDWRERHPGEQIPDGHVFTQPWPAGATDHRRDQVIYCRYSAGSGRRTLHGMDTQRLVDVPHADDVQQLIGKADLGIAGKLPVTRIRFVTLTGADKTINRTLEAEARALAGIKVYVTNLPDPTPDMVIDAYHHLWRIEKSFRMFKHDLRGRPIYQHKRESIDAHMTIVFAALAVTRLIEARADWSIKKFVRTARPYRTVHIRAGTQVLTAEDPLPADLRDALAQIP